jgi:hypothetical protein
MAIKLPWRTRGRHCECEVCMQVSYCELETADNHCQQRSQRVGGVIAFTAIFLAYLSNTVMLCDEVVTILKGLAVEVTSCGSKCPV